MKTKLCIYGLLCLCSLCIDVRAAHTPKREFRGAWIQCVNGQYLNKTPEQIREMLSSQLDRLQQCGINAILFQVRAECDALYPSTYEPWSRFLTGKQGDAPADGWDPLAWMIDQCHERDMECHAWINPYRAKTKGTLNLHSQHVAVRHPERIFEYDGLYILNPALESNRMYTCMVVEDILQRYDVDGIHIDDYFYPYPVANVPLPDMADYERDPRGFATIEDWRRDNVNQLIHALHDLIHAVKPWVKFGVAPFGIYRNDPEQQNSRHGSATRGTQNYDDLYADIVLWQKKGWVDYLIPQIYWNIGTVAADYEVLCNWWNDHCHARPLFIGQDVERTVKGADSSNPQQHQMQAKYDIQRSLSHIQGSCQWYAAAVCNNPGGYADALRTYWHRTPALQPLMPFIDKKAPKPIQSPRIITTQRGITLVWDAPRYRKEMDRGVWYVVYDFKAGEKVNIKDASHIVAVTRKTQFLLHGAYGG
ncbi:MAG: family 10 glycosylhydrolase, partial [Prevotellaceae bacterium]|nr:family 10 glycosylhydrolase [Prevotellaceae bacterium]